MCIKYIVGKEVIDGRDVAQFYGNNSQFVVLKLYPFPNTTNLYQATLKILSPKYGNSLEMRELVFNHYEKFLRLSNIFKSRLLQSFPESVCMCERLKILVQVIISANHIKFYCLYCEVMF